MPSSTRRTGVISLRGLRRSLGSRALTIVTLVAMLTPVTVAGFARPAGAAEGDITTVAGTAGQPGYGGDGGTATSARIAGPYGTVFDAEGDLLIADSENGRVRVVAESASNPGYPLAGCAAACTWTVGDIYTIAGGSNGSEAGGPATSSSLHDPEFLALDAAGNVLLSNPGGQMVEVVAISAANPGYLLAGAGCVGPCTWTVGDIYAIAGTGVRSYTGDGGPSTAAELALPIGLAIDAAGNPLIGDTGNGVVRVVAMSASNPGYALGGCGGLCTWTVGDIYTIAGSGTAGYGGDGGPAASADFDGLTSVAVDAAGNLVLTDSTNNRVRLVAMSASNPGYALGGCGGPCTWTVGDIYTVAGTGVSGYNGDGRTAISATLRAPFDASVDAQGNALIAELGRVRVVAESGANPGYLLAGCVAACTWTVGDIYTVAGGGGGNDGVPATDAEVAPSAVTTDGNGDLFISDTGRNTVREVTLARTVPAAPDTVTAEPGDANATVAWNAPAPNGGSAVTGYVVTPYVAGTAQAPHVLDNTATNAIISGLTNGTTYTFTVAAENAAGAGAQSAASLPITPFGVPAAPSAVRVSGRATSSTTGSVVVSYRAGATNGAPISRFSASCTSGNGGVARSGTHAGGAASPITVAGITLAKTYRCTVTATNARGTGPASAASSPVTVEPPHVPRAGYWTLGASGRVDAFGDAADDGSAGGRPVAIAAKRDGNGYWAVDGAGRVSHFGTAGNLGGSPTLRQGEHVVAVAVTETGTGYWLFTNRGRVVAYGDARGFGDMSATRLAAPVVAAAATPSGHGYYMVGADGGVFTFGDARFRGSAAGLHLNAPVVGIVPTADDRGYWLVAADGGVFSFHAPFLGSMGGVELDRPVVGATAYGNGYLMVGADGGIFDFSDRRFAGSLGGRLLPAPIVGIAAFST